MRSSSYLKLTNQKSRNYHKEKGKLAFIQSVLMFIIMVNVLIFGVFGKLDNYLIEWINDDFYRAALFFGY